MRHTHLRLSLSLTLLASLALLGGCAITPTPLSDAQIQKRVTSDMENMYKEQEQVKQAITFEEAVARALKYNLDYRLKVMESALATGLADVSRFDLLPSLVASAGYSTRSNDSGGTSINIQTGSVSLVPSTSQERQHGTAGIEFSWNVLDFGVSYYRARQQADQVLAAEERRKRVIQNILQDVRSAYWRAVGAQRLAKDAVSLSERVKQALQRSREAEQQGLLPPKEALTYQRQLLDAMNLLAARQQELNYARHELSALMNIPTGATYALALAEEPELRALPNNMQAMEDMALALRPELREEDYRARITADEARRQLLSLLPGLSLNASTQHDSNRYLYHNEWADAGARVSLNLFKLLSLPAARNLQENQKMADDARRLALSMAVLTQVRVASERYKMALQDLEIAKDSTLVDQKLASYARAGASTRTDTELESIRAETRALNSEYQRYAAFAAAQTAYGRLYNALGLDVTPAHVTGADLATLSTEISQHLQRIEQAQFPRVAAPRQTQTSVRLQVNGVTVDEGQDSGLVSSSIKNALERNHIITQPLSDRGPILTLQLQLQPPKDGIRRAEWLISMRGEDGRSTGEARYRSMLPATITPRTLAAFAEAATISHIRTIESWLQAGPAQ